MIQQNTCYQSRLYLKIDRTTVFKNLNQKEYLQTGYSNSKKRRALITNLRNLEIQ